MNNAMYGKTPIGELWFYGFSPNYESFPVDHGFANQQNKSTKVLQ